MTGVQISIRQTNTHHGVDIFSLPSHISRSISLFYHRFLFDSFRLNMSHSTHTFCFLFFIFFFSNVCIISHFISFSIHFTEWWQKQVQDGAFNKIIELIDASWTSVNYQSNDNVWYLYFAFVVVCVTHEKCERFSAWLLVYKYCFSNIQKKKKRSEMWFQKIEEKTRNKNRHYK